MVNTKTFSRAICHSYSLVFGMIGIGIFPGLIKIFENTYALSHTQMGIIMGVGSVFMAAFALAGGIFSDRYSARIVMVVAMVFCAVSALGIWSAASPLMFILFVLTFHCANGMGCVVNNSIVARLYGSERRAHGINLMHGFQGMGMLLAPIVIIACLAVFRQWNRIFVISAIFHLGCLYLFIRMGDTEFESTATIQAFNLQEAISCLSNLRVVFGLIGFIFASGCEMVIITWIAAYLETEAGYARTLALFALTVIMIGYTSIRIVLGIIRRNMSTWFMSFCLCVNLISFLVLMMVKNKLLVFVACFTLGFSFGSYWPCLAAAIYNMVPAARYGLFTGIFSIMSVTGMFLCISLVGWLGDVFSLRQALVVSPICALVFTIIYGAVFSVPDYSIKEARAK